VGAEAEGWADMTPQLHNQDCFEFMETLADQSIDAVISDPPYGTTALEWDKAPDLSKFWQHILRVTKPTAPIVLFSAQPFTTDLIVSNRKIFRYEVIWCKTMPTGFLDANRRPLRAHENILVFCREGYGSYKPQLSKTGKAYTALRDGSKANHYGDNARGNTINNGERHPLTYISYSNGIQDNVHPTQKPLELLVYLVRTYSNKGDTVLDPYAGSATTLHACALEGRQGIGCELSPEYYAKAKKRLAAVMAQPKLLELV
jgi:site-specific DNA-methyltransferase (adenine-specific)